ncbi:MAG: hypothetical protein H7A21_01425 [Spirochaetales bacterium]|nr:hypothetical protein [Leptospiraceae bacterium]MCP5480068.1 hypothetical protein [Spirochaetales bacterium]MCP5485591.1 hypothetical protein [Spirochaetales bacterium]
MGPDKKIIEGEVWLIGAFEPEIDLLMVLEDQLIDLPIGSGQQKEKFRVRTFATGVGSLTAALTVLGRAQELGAPFEMVFVGSSGAYPNDSEAEAGEAYAFSTRFFGYDVLALEGRAHIPAPMQVEAAGRTGPVGRWLETELKKRLKVVYGAINSTSSVTLAFDAKLEKDKGGAFSKTGMRFENLEAFGVARAAEKLDAAFVAITAVTNLVGPDGSRQWQSRHRPMSEQLQTTLLSILRPTRPENP